MRSLITFRQINQIIRSTSGRFFPDCTIIFHDDGDDLLGHLVVFAYHCQTRQIDSLQSQSFRITSPDNSFFAFSFFSSVETSFAANDQLESILTFGCLGFFDDSFPQFQGFDLFFLFASTIATFYIGAFDVIFMLYLFSFCGAQDFSEILLNSKD